jgi:hypothetical protein
MKISIYYPEQGAGHPVATLVLGDRRDQACRLPGRLDPRARFFLERVEAEDPALEARLIDVLTRDTIMVNRATARTRGPVRTRGDYRAEEPYGTPAYWRAAIGRIPHDVGLDYDLDDYRAMLAWVDQPVAQSQPAAAQSVRPAYNQESEPSPTGLSIQDLIGQILGVGGLAFARQMGGSPESQAEAEPTEAPPLDLDDLARQAERDPELARAIHHLRAALARPEFRSTVLLALEAFARAAAGAGDESGST